MQKAPPEGGAFRYPILFVFGVFALLICNTAGGLASGLAGCLAFAAAALYSAFAEVTGFDSLDMYHDESPFMKYSEIIIAIYGVIVNTNKSAKAAQSL